MCVCTVTMVTNPRWLWSLMLHKNLNWCPGLLDNYKPNPSSSRRMFLTSFPMIFSRNEIGIFSIVGCNLPINRDVYKIFNRGDNYPDIGGYVAAPKFKRMLAANSAGTTRFLKLYGKQVFKAQSTSCHDPICIRSHTASTQTP